MDDQTRQAVEGYVRRRYGRLNKPSRLVIDLDGQGRVVDSDLTLFPLSLLRGSEDEPDEPDTNHASVDTSVDEPRHSPDFACVFDGVRQFNFTPGQRAIIRLLWQARDNRTPVMSGDYLLEESGSMSRSLRDVFKGHPAWGELVVQVDQGTYRLQFPADIEAA